MYEHRVQYYETDKMGITHHSNYVRWMEEARVAFLDEIGWSFAGLESRGVFSPVIGVDCRYRQSSTFNEVISICVEVAALTGAKLKLRYRMINAEGAVVCTGHSEHCFVRGDGHIVRLKRELPEFYEALASRLVPEGGETAP